MFLKKMNRAMRYYRFWIYSCNIALMVATLIYLIAFIYVLNDEKMMLFPSIKLYEPTFLYSYCAIILQGGVLQAIGCFGAIRLNENLLNLYLFLMIVLLFGDGILGIVWILRFNTIVAKLRGDLRLRLTNDYGMDIEFQDAWDRIQIEYQCCGIDGPFDYNMTSLLEQNYEIVDPRQLFPKSCCRQTLPDLPNEQIFVRHKCVTSYDPDLANIYGCYDHIQHWLQHSADLLSVLGFCIITFIKVCFLAILRYEIKEMIQKIKVLNDMSDSTTVPVHDLEAYLPRPSIVQTEAAQALLANVCSQSTYNKPYSGHHHHHQLLTSACGGSCISDKPRGNSIGTTTGNVSDISQCQSQSQSKKQSLV